MEYYLAIKRNQVLILPFTELHQATALSHLAEPRELCSGEGKTEDLWSGKHQAQHKVGVILLKKEKLGGSSHAPCDG